MDPRRRLTPLAAAGVLTALGAPAAALAAAGTQASAPEAAPISGERAIAAANRAARAPSRSDRFEAGLQIFAYEPGRIYEIWTAPLRLTALTLSPGETIADLAAGDTVRWKIGETAMGEGATRRAVVLLKPLETGLETNLVLTTSRRTYLMALRAGPAASANAAIAWTPEASAPPLEADRPAAPAPDLTPPDLPLAGAYNAAYRIMPKGRRPRWTPTAVLSDGVRTFIAFPGALATGEAPVLHVLGPDGAPRMVNYRQAGDLFIVDQLIDRAELRLGAGRKAEIVILTRSEADHER